MTATTERRVAWPGPPEPGANTVPDVSTLPGPVADVIEHAYGTGVGEIFLIAAPLGLIAFAAVALMREVPLGGRSGIDIARERATTHDHHGAPS